MLKRIAITAITVAFISSSAFAIGNSSAAGGHAKVIIGDHTLKNKATQNSDNKSTNEANPSQKIKIEGDEAFDLPVNTAYAPLNIPTSDCLGSVSAGGQGQFFGFSLGGTTQSKPCNIREFSKIFRMRHEPDLEFAILCQDSIVRKAVESTGRFCPNSKVSNNDICAYPTQACKDFKRFR